MAILKDLFGETANQVLDNLGVISDKYIILEKIIPVVNDMLTDQASELRQLNKELGGGSKTVANFRSSIADLSKTIGVSIRDFTELADSTKQYHQGIINTTASTLKFAKAVGVMPSNLGEMSAKLTILGHTSEETFDEMYENILAVRGAYGLTDDQINDIIAVTTKYAIATQATDEQLKQTTLTISKFTSQLTSAGIEATRVAELLNSMIDPDQLTDNLVLMSKLGISVGDMISGDPTTKLEGATERMKELGQEITAIAKNNRMQANEMAKVYGLTLEEATMLANLDTSEKALNTQKKLDQYRSEMATFSESIKGFMNMLGGAVSKPLLLVGNILQRFTDTLNILPRGLSSLIVGFLGKKLLNKISDKLGEAALRFGKKVAEPMKSYLDGIADRISGKSKDMAGLTPKREKELELSYGRGLDFNLKAEKRRAAFNKKNLGMQELTDEEKIENVQAMNKQIRELENYRSNLESKAKYDSVASNELELFNKTYGSFIETFREKFNGMIDAINKTETSWNRNGREYADLENLKNYSKLNNDTRKKNFKAISEQLTNQGVKDITGLGIGNGTGENDKSIAEIASISKGPKEFMEKLIEFWRLSDNPEASEYLKNAEQGLKDINDAAFKGVESFRSYKESIEAVNEASINGRKEITLKDRLGNFGQGIITNATTLLKKLWNPKKLLLGLGGGVLLKIGSALMQSEKAQESIATITEKIGEWVSSFTEKVSPFIESVAEAVTGLFGLIEPTVTWLIDKISKLANWVGGGINKAVKNISNSVSTIEDSYKEEDLRTMVGGYKGRYNEENDDLIISVLEKISSKIDKTNETAKHNGEFQVALATNQKVQ